MIERLDCISVFRELLSITYLRARLLATHNQHSIPYTIRRVYLPSPLFTLHGPGPAVYPKTPHGFSTFDNFLYVPTVFGSCSALSAAAWAQRQIVFPPCVYSM
jgi:hypothetical protein